jgi:hypothetical protein
MKLVMTVMVRDEIDIIAAMIEHHLAQGADLIIATDNGSIDGTAEVLQRYADLGVLELHHDPVFRKQQHAVVTGMARRACTEHGADWVVNADADEFWAPVDKRLTLHQALSAIPVSLNAFTAPVTNLVGPPAMRGSGIDRLLWRDHRTQEQLNEVGIYAQPTSDAVHRGDPNVVVAQGNHFVSLESKGQPDPAHALEVLHLPWRSWLQLEQKVAHAGRAYESNPDLKPSKNHHGMADYRRYQAGRLEYAFLLRQPLERDLVAGQAHGTFAYDTWLRDELHALADRARIPELLAPCLDGSADAPFDPAEHERAAEIGRMFVDLERERDDAVRRADTKSPARPPRIRDDWVRVNRRTAGAIKRRIGRMVRRRR